MAECPIQVLNIEMIIQEKCLKILKQGAITPDGSPEYRMMGQILSVKIV